MQQLILKILWTFEIPTIPRPQDRKISDFGWGCYHKYKAMPNTSAQSMLANLLRNGKSLVCYFAPNVLLNRIQKIFALFAVDFIRSYYLFNSF
jgi:hypothetical protein